MSSTAPSPAFDGPAQAAAATPTRSRGFWAETWVYFRRRYLAVAALVYVIIVCLIALFSPAIAGTKPVVAYYQGDYYFPALAYYNRDWEPPNMRGYHFGGNYPKGLAESDPEGWALWPLVFQDPYARVQQDDWPGLPGNPDSSEGAPNRYNVLGTDLYGVDVFAQMVHGTRTAVTVGFVSMGIASLIGITIGAISGYLGGWVDVLLSRLTEVVMCVPTLVLIVAILALIREPTIYHLMAIIGVTAWTGIARLTRAEFLKLRESDYVMAARALGVGPLRIIFRHILPNSLAPILVPIIFGIAVAILTESALAFLGLGPPPTHYASWGNLLREGRSNYQMWWLVLFPGMAVFITVLAYNLIGEGIQEATDPRTRETGKIS